MKAISILLVILNIFLITEIYIKSFQIMKENDRTDKTILFPLVFFFLLLITNCVLLLIFYLIKKQILITFQRIILLLVLIAGSIGVCIFSR
jgi:hypothetical protein